MVSLWEDAAKAAQRSAQIGIQSASTQTALQTTQQNIQQSASSPFVKVAAGGVVSGASVYISSVPPAPEIPSPPKIYQFTNAAYHQLMERKFYEALAQRDEWRRQKREIDINAFYIDPITGETISGKDVITRYFPEEQYTQLSSDFEKAAEAWSQSSNIPEYVDISGTTSGSIINMSVNPVEKERYEWKTLNPAQQFGKALYVGATKWPDLIYQQIPVVGSYFTGAKNTTDLSKKWIAEEGQLWDKTQQKDYGAVAWNATSSPAMIEAYTAGVMVAAKPVSKLVIKGGVKTIGEMSRFVPEESIVNKLITKGGQRIVDTEVGGNIYKWGAKGYKFGYQTGAKTIASRGGREIVMDWTRVESVPTKTIIGGGRNAERVLMSPEQQRIAKATLEELTTKKAGTNVVWRMGQTDVVVENNFKRSMFGNKFVKRDLRISGSFVDEFLEQPAVELKSAYGGFEEKVFKKGLTEDIYTGIGGTELKPYVATYREPMRMRLFGYSVSADKKALNFQFGMIKKPESVWVKYKKLIQPTFVTPGTRTSKINAFKNMVLPKGEGAEGIYKISANPFKEEFAVDAKRALRTFENQHPFKKFIADTRANLNTVITKSEVVFGKSEGKTNYGLASRVSHPYLIPAKDITNEALAGLQPILFTGVRETQKQHEELKPAILFGPNEHERQYDVPVETIFFTPKEHERIGFAVSPVSITSTKQDYTQLLTTISDYNFFDIDTPTITTPTYSPPPPVIPVIFPIPPFKGGMSGGWGNIGRRYGKGYRFRSWSVPTVRSMFPSYKRFRSRKWSV